MKQGNAMSLGFIALVGSGVVIYSAFSGKTIADVVFLRAPGGATQNAYTIPGTNQVINDPSAKDANGLDSDPALAAASRGPRGTSTPIAKWNPERKQIPNWIIKNLEAADKAGIDFEVSSGWRTAAEQEAAAGNYGLQHYPAGPQASNHRTVNYPGGAVDIRRGYEELGKWLRTHGPIPRLTWSAYSNGNQGDVVHFSAHGN